MKLHKRLCRPPEDAFDVEKWNGHQWLPDDGKPGYAFSYMQPVSAEAQFGYTTPYPCAGWVPLNPTRKQRAEMPDARSRHEELLGYPMRRTCARWGVANGVHLKPVKAKKPAQAKKPAGAKK